MVTTIGPPREYGPKATKYGITIHSTENTSASARDEANYAKNRTDGTSSHYYVDDREVIRSLSTAYGANHAGPSWPNAHCIAYEFCGTARWSTSTWMSKIDWDAAAKQIAADCVQWKIAADWLTITELKAHKRGLSTHDDCRRAFGGTDHTDPGGNFPKTHLLSRVKHFLQGDDVSAPEVWKFATPPGKDIDEYSDDDSWQVINVLRSAQTWAYRATKEARALEAHLDATDAKVDALMTSVEELKQLIITGR